MSDQILLPGAFTADFTVARALLKAGRKYEDAVQQICSLPGHSGAKP